MQKKYDIVAKLFAVVLLVAAALKAWQLLTEPAAHNNIWTARPVLIFQVEFEFVLGIWLFSGLLRKAAWLAGLACFSVFSLVTLYKAVNGAESCGCFGPVHVKPLVTLFTVDLPAVVLFSVFRPALEFARGTKSIKALLTQFIMPLPSAVQLKLTASLILTALAVTTPVLAFNKPSSVTSSYEVLEPESWLGQKTANNRLHRRRQTT